MITKSMPLLMLLMSILCSSCTEDSSSPAKEENIITKSKIKPEHYIPMDAENTYKYILSSSIIEKPSYTETTYYDIIEMSVWSGQHFTLNYAIDTNLANYFGRDRYYRNGTEISEVFYKMGLDYTTFHFAIDNDGLAIKNLLIDTTFKAKYPYLKLNVNKADNHYWIDFWVGDTLLTIDYDRVLPASMDTVI